MIINVLAAATASLSKQMSDSGLMPSLLNKSEVDIIVNNSFFILILAISELAFKEFVEDKTTEIRKKLLSSFCNREWIEKTCNKLDYFGSESIHLVILFYEQTSRALSKRPWDELDLTRGISRGSKLWKKSALGHSFRSVFPR